MKRKNNIIIVTHDLTFTYSVIACSNKALVGPLALPITGHKAEAGTRVYV